MRVNKKSNKIKIENDIESLEQQKNRNYDELNIKEKKRAEEKKMKNTTLMISGHRRG